MLSLIAAISENRVIGNENKLLWHIPEDMKRFKNLTMGHPIIMGRKTFQSIGRVLPGRTNIIVTRDKSFKVDNCIVVHSIGEAIKQAQSINSEEIFIIGGGQIYEQTIGLVDKLYLTIVKGNFSGDTHFLDYSLFNKVVYKKEGVHKNLAYTFLELIRST